jgi:predicted Zn-dependent protease
MRSRPAILLALVLGGALLGLACTPTRQASPHQAQLDSAQQLARAGQAAEAERVLQEVVQADPNSSEAWEQLGRLYMHTKRYRDAIEPLRRVTELKPETPGVYGRLAECLQRSGDPVHALEQAREGLKRDPNDVRALVAAAKVVIAQGNEREGLEYERRLVQINQNDPDFLIMYAKSLVQYRRYDEAAPVLANLLRLAPNSPDGYNLRGQITFYQNPTPEGLVRAEADFQKTLQLSPGAYPPLLFLGRIANRRNQPEKAIAYLQQARRGAPARGEADFVLAEAYELMGQKAKAAEARRRFQAWREADDLEKALVKRCSLDSDNFADHLQLGQIKLRKRELIAADYYLRRALELRPQDAEALAAVRQLESLTNAARASASSPTGGP